MDYPPDARQTTNVETATPLDQLPMLQRFILMHLMRKANDPLEGPYGTYYPPDPMLAGPHPRSRLDFDVNMPPGRFNWGQNFKSFP